MKRPLAWFCVFLFAAAASSQTIPELFATGKQQVKAGAWADALKTFETLEAESAKPGNEAVHKQLEGPLAFYRGVCEASLGQTDEAIADFGAFLKVQPNAEIDKETYSKKAVSAFEKAQKAAAERAPSLAEAYKEFQPPADARQADPADPRWSDGPVRWILTDPQKKAWSELADPNARVEFVEKFWEARDPLFRKEFERRVDFADANLAQDPEQPGSLTDRGMVFVLLGPPTFAGRKPLRTGDDANDDAGMSGIGSQDAKNADKYARRDPNKKIKSGTLATLSVQYGGPGKKAVDIGENRMEVWHYRRELLPKGVPYQQVDFEFVTKQGYGVNTMQRESHAVNTLDAAKSVANKS